MQYSSATWTLTGPTASLISIVKPTTNQARLNPMSVRCPHKLISILAEQILEQDPVVIYAALVGGSDEPVNAAEWATPPNLLINYDC